MGVWLIDELGMGQYKDCPLDDKSLHHSHHPTTATLASHTQHLIIMSSYDCDVSADFADVFDLGREGMIYSSLTKENKRGKTPVPCKLKGKPCAPPRKPRGQPLGDWSGPGEEGDGLDIDDLLTPFVLLHRRGVDRPLMTNIEVVKEVSRDITII